MTSATPDIVYPEEHVTVYLDPDSIVSVSGETEPFGTVGLLHPAGVKKTLILRCFRLMKCNPYRTTRF